MPDSEGEWGSTWGVAITAGMVGVFLVGLSVGFPKVMTFTGLAEHLPLQASEENPLAMHPFAELLKLVCATLIGVGVTAVHKRYHRDKPLPRSLQQAQVLLCVAGALIMVIIGSNLARAFGVAGAAGIVRFRTPVEDPKDTTLLFLLIGLGMACGIGLLDLAGLGAVFLCLVLAALDRFGEAKQRQVMLSLVATGREFPTEAVGRVLGASVDFYEIREVVQGNEAVVRYNITMDPSTSVSWLSQQLQATGLKSVSWGEPSKKDKV